MSEAATVKRNSYFLLLSSAVRLVTSFILFAGVARLYGPEAFGQFATASTISNFFLLLADFGFDTLLAVEVARERRHVSEIVREFLSLKIVTAVCASIGMFFVPFLFHMSDSTTTLTYVFSLNVAFSSLLNFFFALFKGLEKMKHEARISFAINIISLCCLVLFGWLNLPLYAFVALFIGTRILGLMMALRVSTSLLGHRWFKFSLEGWSTTKRQVLVFGVYVLLGTLYFQMDTLLLAFWKGDRDVGVYQAAFKIIVLTLVIPDIAVNALMPTLSRLHTESLDRWTTVGHLLFKTLFLAALPIAMILFVYAEQVVHLIYGDLAFADAVPVLRIFAVIGFVRFAAEPFGLLLTTARRQEIRMRIIVLAAIANLCMNAYMIPLYGPVGAAKVSLITNVLVGAAYVFATRPFFGSWIFNLATVIPFVVMITLSLALWYIRIIPMWCTGMLGVALCGLVSYWIGYTRVERTMLFSMKSG